jgi:hypothetical protein
MMRTWLYHWTHFRHFSSLKQFTHVSCLKQTALCCKCCGIRILLSRVKQHEGHAQSHTCDLEHFSSLHYITSGILSNLLKCTHLRIAYTEQHANTVELSTGGVCNEREECDELPESPLPCDTAVCFPNQSPTVPCHGLCRGMFFFPADLRTQPFW